MPWQEETRHGLVTRGSAARQGQGWLSASMSAPALGSVSALTEGVVMWVLDPSLWS